jgi:hypothetical protein
VPRSYWPAIHGMNSNLERRASCPVAGENDPPTVSRRSWRTNSATITWDEYSEARKQGDNRRLQELELRCDGIDGDLSGAANLQLRHLV